MNEEDEDLPDFLEAAADDDDEEDLEAIAQRSPVYDENEALAEAAWGHFTTDEAAEAADDGEIEGMGKAAGLRERPDLDPERDSHK